MASKRDSSSMKVIALLTTVFLPGAFVGVGTYPAFNRDSPGEGTMLRHRATDSTEYSRIQRCNSRQLAILGDHSASDRDGHGHADLVDVVDNACAAKGRR